MNQFFMRFPQGKRKALTLSYDDGVEQDVKLIEIMTRNGLKGTFNLNSGLYKKEGVVYAPGTIHRRMDKASISALYTKNGMEVAVHGLTHPFLERMPQSEVVREIAKDRENLEEQFDVIVRGMAYPFGTYSDEVVEVLKNCGICYARTVESTHRFDLPMDWLRMPATCHHDDPKLMELAENFVNNKSMQSRFGQPELFYLWGHSYEFEANDNWEVIERFAEYMAGREEIWYATNLEIYEYTEAFRKLVFSMDGKKIYNPTCQTIWYDYEGIGGSIAPGETRVFDRG